LSGLCFFNVDVAQACAGEDEPSYSIVEHELKTTGKKLGSLVDSHPDYKNPILEGCLRSITKSQRGVIPPSTPQEIIHFFEDQELVKHVDKPEYNEDGHLETFNHTYGLEFSGHGPVEEKVIELINSLMGQGNVSFLDIGAGYGAFAKRVIEACKGDLDKMTIYVNECLSVQCYHAAKLLEGWKQVLFYPGDILRDRDYYNMGRQFNVSTIFNVHHFMKTSDFRGSIERAYKLTLKDGYHIAVALSPYHLGDDSELAKRHDERTEQYEDYPGYFTWSDFFQLKAPLREYAHFPSKEVYERVFQKAGFSVEESGYFSLNKKYPREFTYIIGKRNKR
jgi:hypothetical protein